MAKSQPSMLRKTHLHFLALLAWMPLITVGASTPDASQTLTAAQVVDRNVAARGGQKSWLAVQTMTFSGKLEAGGKQNVQLPFVMEMKRGHKTRLEIEFQNDKAVQVYDGTNGWKLRPFLGRRDVEPYTHDEMKMASAESDLDGPLVDYAAKGTKVELEGLETVEGHNTYKIKLILKGGQERHIWVDAQTFLEVKIEGNPRRLDGKMQPVEIYYRDFRPVNGLMIPYVLETAVQGVRQTHKMIIEKVVVNAKLEDSVFMKPDTQGK
jgi:outer membrane lipoprotein-sorting protein